LKTAVPAHACNSHVHVIGDMAQFPMIASRRYTPALATTAMLAGMHRALGIDRAVVVQPSVYGADNACLLAALRELGSKARGIAVVSQDASDAVLDELDAAGVVGLRIRPDATVPDVVAFGRRLRDVADRIAGRGWHIQTSLKPAAIAELQDCLAALPVPVVFDHFAGASPEDLDRSRLDAVFSLLKAGCCYVKLSAPYHASKVPDYADMTAVARALVAANSACVLWGSDWPHTPTAARPGARVGEVAPGYLVDDGALLALLADWVPDAAQREAILVDNPTTLFRFPSISAPCPRA
jgi:predicted TIM-barrel fold metal-dependent hydrolase